MQSESETNNEPVRVPRITFLHKIAKEYLSKPETFRTLLTRSTKPPENAWVQLMNLSLLELKLISDCRPSQGDELVQIIAQFFYFARRSELSTGLPQTFLMDGMDSYLMAIHRDWCTTWWMKYRSPCQYSVTFIALAVRSGCELYVEKSLKDSRRHIKGPEESLQKTLPSLPSGANLITRPLSFFSLDIGMVADEWLPEDMIEVLLNHGLGVSDPFEGTSFWQEILLVSVDFLVPMHTERIISLLLDHGANVSQIIDLGGYKCTPFN